MNKVEISITPGQLFEVVKKLNRNQKIELLRELEKDMIESKLCKLLNEFYTDELSNDEIDSEIEIVRDEQYKKRLKK